VEWICNHFAACLLMPKLWVNRLWANGIQDPLAMAAVFKASAEAMKVRLDTFGYFGATPRPHETFFRRSMLPDEALAEVPLAELVLAA
jgi:Zn-dependent peptidase ImmA (M78 family)